MCQQWPSPASDVLKVSLTKELRMAFVRHTSVCMGMLQHYSEPIISPTQILPSSNNNKRHTPLEIYKWISLHPCILALLLPISRWLDGLLCRFLCFCHPEFLFSYVWPMCNPWECEHQGLPMCGCTICQVQVVRQRVYIVTSSPCLKSWAVHLPRSHSWIFTTTRCVRAPGHYQICSQSLCTHVPCSLWHC